MLLNDTDFIKLPLLIGGKVRNVYDLGQELLIVVTDRISAFDVVFSELIPYKGQVLNSIAAYWFGLTEHIIANHMISTDPADLPDQLQPYAKELAGRSMLVKKISMLPAECIVRGYLEGSALKEYRQKGSVSGYKLPAGLKQGDRLPEPLFTPSTKAEQGHDINITYEELCDLLGPPIAAQLKEKSIELYRFAAAQADTRNLILADTKFEFGLKDGELMLADEIFTPDSSRFWEKTQWQPGQAQKSFDKQYLREWLEQLDWDKTPPAPALPMEIINATSAKYLEAYQLITGQTLPYLAKEER